MDNYMYSPKYLNLITHNKLVYYQYRRSPWIFPAIRYDIAATGGIVNFFILYIVQWLLWHFSSSNWQYMYDYYQNLKTDKNACMGHYGM